jgi:hypothetical protein
MRSPLLYVRQLAPVPKYYVTPQELLRAFPKGIRGSSITLRQKKTAQQYNGTPLTLTLDSAPVDGDLLVLLFSSNSTPAATTVGSITQTGATWVLAGRVGAAKDAEMWYALGVSGAGTTVTINITVGGNTTYGELATVLDYAGPNIFDAFTTVDGAQTADAGMAAFPNEVVVALLSSDAAQPTSVGNGYTMQEQQYITWIYQSVADKIITSAEEITTTFVGGANALEMVIGSFAYGSVSKNNVLLLPYVRTTGSQALEGNH